MLCSAPKLVKVFTITLKFPLMVFVRVEFQECDAIFFVEVVVSECECCSVPCLRGKVTG